MAMAAAPPVLLQELIVEILSRLPVKDLMRFRCVSKSWNSLMFDPLLVKLHLQRSSKNTQFLLTFSEVVKPEAVGEKNIICEAVAPCSIRRLLEDPSSAIDDSLFRFNENNCVFGACNGLVCLLDYFVGDEFNEYWFRFCNPATKIMSEDSPRLLLHSSDYRIGDRAVECGFGFDDSRDAYKVVAIPFNVKSQEREVRVHCLGDTCWTKILTCPAFPTLGQHDGQFASGTLNWLALRKLSFDYEWKTVTMDQLVIFSYDLKNETYTYLSMPGGLLEVPLEEPSLGVLNGRLCLSHDHGQTHFVLWLMREFGIEKSWTQLLNVSYDHLLPIHGSTPCKVVPLCLSENEDVLFLADCEGSEFVIYDRRNNTIDNDHGYKDYTFAYASYDYVQSLVMPY